MQHRNNVVLAYTYAYLYCSRLTSPPTRKYCDVREQCTFYRTIVGDVWQRFYFKNIIANNIFQIHRNVWQYWCMLENIVYVLHIIAVFNNILFECPATLQNTEIRNVVMPHTFYRCLKSYYITLHYRYFKRHLHRPNLARCHYFLNNPSRLLSKYNFHLVQIAHIELCSIYRFL